MKKFVIMLLCLCIISVPVTFADEPTDDTSGEILEEEEYTEDQVTDESEESSGDIDTTDENSSWNEYRDYETDIPSEVMSVPDGITVILDGKIVVFDAAQPKFVNSRTMVPMRKMFEALGAEVDWDIATSTAIATKGDMTVQISIGSNVMYSNGNPIEIDAPAQLINSKTYVPVRFISNALGAKVDWDGDNKIVYINTVE